MPLQKRLCERTVSNRAAVIYRPTGMSAALEHGHEVAQLDGNTESGLAMKKMFQPLHFWEAGF